MLKWFKKIKHDLTKPLPEPSIKEGSEVMYLGVEWTVTRSYYIDVFSTRKLERIADNGMHNSVNVPFNSTLVTLSVNA